MLYQLSYTPKQRAETWLPFFGNHDAATMALSQSGRSLAVRL